MKRRWLRALAVVACVALCCGPNVKEFGIQYHNGRVIREPTVYVIWYGTWPAEDKALIEDFLRGLDGSPYWSIHTTYTDGSGKPLSGALHYGGSADDAYSHGSEIGVGALNDDIDGVLSDAIGHGLPPFDPNGIYLVLTAADASWNETFGTSFCAGGTCGLHSFRNLTFNRKLVGVPFAVVGNGESKCPSACGWASRSDLPPPNGQPGPDAMITSIAHELSEAITDPDADAWNGGSCLIGSCETEDGDKCEKYDHEFYVTAAGARANLKLSGRDFFAQDLWVNGPPYGYCAMRPLGELTVRAFGSGNVIAGQPDYFGQTAANCSALASVCSALYAPGSTLIYTAVPNPNWGPVTWQGCDSTQASATTAGALDCTVTAPAGGTTYNVTANFGNCTPGPLDMACFAECQADCGRGSKPNDCAYCKLHCEGC